MLERTFKISGTHLEYILMQFIIHLFLCRGVFELVVTNRLRRRHFWGMLILRRVIIGVDNQLI